MIPFSCKLVFGFNFEGENLNTGLGPFLYLLPEKSKCQSNQQCSRQVPKSQMVMCETKDWELLRLFFLGILLNIASKQKEASQPNTHIQTHTHHPTTNINSFHVYACFPVVFAVWHVILLCIVLLKRICLSSLSGFVPLTIGISLFTVFG